jgi:hypothetical protein
MSDLIVFVPPKTQAEFIEKEVTPVKSTLKNEVHEAIKVFYERGKIRSYVAAYLGATAPVTGNVRTDLAFAAATLKEEALASHEYSFPKMVAAKETEIGSKLREVLKTRFKFEQKE